MHLCRFLVVRDSAVSGRWIDLLDKFIDADSPQPREQKTNDADAPWATGVTRLTIDVSGAERTKCLFVADARAVASRSDKQDSGYGHRGDANEY